MACYLRTISEDTECGACNNTVKAGQIIWTDEIDHGCPLCDTCGSSLDSTLAATVKALRELDETLAE